MEVGNRLSRIFDARKSAAEPKSFPPVGRAESRVVGGQLMRLSATGSQDNLPVGARFAHHPELVDNVGIALAVGFRSDGLRAASGVRGVLCRAIDHRVASAEHVGH